MKYGLHQPKETSDRLIFPQSISDPSWIDVIAFLSIGDSTTTYKEGLGKAFADLSQAHDKFMKRWLLDETSIPYYNSKFALFKNVQGIEFARRLYRKEKEGVFRVLKFPSWELQGAQRDQF